LSSTAHRIDVRRASPASVIVGKCPKGVLVGASGLAPAEDVIGAARRLIPRTYTDPAYSSFIIQSVFSLEPVVAGLRDPARFRAFAAARCGRSVALGSWVVAVQFPGAPIATAGLGIVYLVKTRSGWKLWGKIDPVGMWPEPTA
jgi:hypothetical protein